MLKEPAMLKELTENITKNVVEAGDILLKHYKKPHLKIYTKEDQSPVTEADYEVSDYFLQVLEKYGKPIVTEEKIRSVDVEEDYFIIDPLDGTRYFIDGEDHYAILLALVSRRRPIMGITYFPALNLLYTAQKGQGSFLNGAPIANTQTRQNIVAFSAGFHKRIEAQELIHHLKIQTVMEQESVLKMTRLAEGVADFYPRFGRTYEWDTASTQILLEEAGCSVYDVHTLRPLEYSKKEYKNNGFVVFRNDLKQGVLEALGSLQLKRSWAVTDLDDLKQETKKFCEEREWDMFHNPKELSIGMVTEASELLEIFRFKSVDDCESLLQTVELKKVEDEISDVLFFILRFSQKYNIDLVSAFKNKMEQNRKKYPVEKARGSNKKYSEL